MVRAMASLLAFSQEQPEIKSILDLYDQGTVDEVWVPELSAQKESVIVITCDRAKRRGGAKLPSLCQQYGLTHVLVSGKLHEKKQFEKARAVITVWSDLVK